MNRELLCLSIPEGMLNRVWWNPEVKKLPSVAAVEAKNACPWLAKNLRIKQEDGGRRLRLSFQAGKRAEQVVILNALLRVYIQLTVTERIQSLEKAIRNIEEGKPRLAKDIREERDANNLKRYQQEWETAKVREADFRAEIARLKQVAVIKWADK